MKYGAIMPAAKKLEVFWDKDVAAELAVSIKERSHDVANYIVARFNKEEEQYITWMGKDGIIQAVRAVGEIENGDVASEFARAIAMRAGYIRADECKEVIEELSKVVKLYDTQSALSILGAWETALYNRDWGDPEGGVILSRIMQDKLIVEGVRNLFERTGAKGIAGTLADIANYLRNQELVTMAAIAITSIEDAAGAQAFAKHLSIAAEKLRRPSDSMHIGWYEADDKGRESFMKEVLKGPSRTKLLKRN